MEAEFGSLFDRKFKMLAIIDKKRESLHLGTCTVFQMTSVLYHACIQRQQDCDK